MNFSLNPSITFDDSTKVLESKTVHYKHIKTKSEDISGKSAMNRHNINQAIKEILKSNSTINNFRVSNRRNNYSSNSTSFIYNTEDDMLKSNGTNVLNAPCNKELYNNIKPSEINIHDKNLTLNSANALFLTRNSLSSAVHNSCGTPNFNKTKEINFINEGENEHRKSKGLLRSINSFKSENILCKMPLSSSIHSYGPSMSENCNGKKNIMKDFNYLFEDLKSSKESKFVRPLSSSKRVKSKFDTISDIISGTIQEKVSNDNTVE